MPPIKGGKRSNPCPSCAPGAPPHSVALPKFIPVCRTTARPLLKSDLCGAIWSPNPMAASMQAAFGSCPAEYESRLALASI
jgi:hypothetical protein